jgi:CheY-like chemotaxis protein
MPVTFVSFASLIFLAILGGLLHLFLRRLILGLQLQPVTASPLRPFRSCLKPPGASAPFSPAPRPTSATPFPPPAQGELLLLVEDDAAVRNMLNTVLLNHGYEVVTARDGLEALAFFRKYQTQLALIITDVDMPKSNGRTFADHVRPLRPDIPILFMSGLDCNEADRPPGTARSHDPFLLKPFKPAALLNTIHGLLHPAAPLT